MIKNNFFIFLISTIITTLIIIITTTTVARAWLGLAQILRIIWDQIIFMYIFKCKAAALVCKNNIILTFTELFNNLS